MLMPQIAFKDTRTSYLGQIMILLLIAVIPQITSEGNSMTLSLIMIMPEIIHITEFYFLFVSKHSFH